MKLKTMLVASAAALVTTLGASLSAASTIDAKAANELMVKATCNACHQVDKKVLGPAYKDVASKYKNNAKAADLLLQKVRAGGANVWGPIPMPPNPKEKISDDDLKKLIIWILSL